MSPMLNGPDPRPSFYLYGDDAKACLAAKDKAGKVKVEVELETEDVRITKKEPFVEARIMVNSIGNRKITGRPPYTMEYGTQRQRDIGKTIRELKTMEAKKADE